MTTHAGGGRASWAGGGALRHFRDGRSTAKEPNKAQRWEEEGRGGATPPVVYKV